MRNVARLLLLAPLLLIVPGCPGGGTLPPPAPDFALQDVNPTSPTFNQDVSPRDRIDKVSGYYFGEAT